MKNEKIIISMSHNRTQEELNVWNEISYEACYLNDIIPLVHYMIECGADPNHAFQGACQSGDINLVKEVLKYSVRKFDWGLVGACEGVFYTDTSMEKFYEIVDFLAEKGIDLNEGIEHIKTLQARYKLEKRHQAVVNNNQKEFENFVPNKRLEELENYLKNHKFLTKPILQ